MKKNTRETEYRREGKILLPLTIGVGLLLLLYCVVTIMNSCRVNRQVHIMADHPFKNIISAGRVETGVEQIRLLGNHLISTDDENATEEILQKYNITQERMRSLTQCGRHCRY